MSPFRRSRVAIPMKTSPSTSTPVCPISFPSPQGEEQWFVLRVTYQRELAAKVRLEGYGIECFLPMQRIRRRTPQGRFHYVEEPVVHNFIFVHTHKNLLDWLKHGPMPSLRYMMVRDGAGSRIMTVPDVQMRSFIAIAGNKEEQSAYVNPDELRMVKGDKVRVIAGPFIGVEGIFVRLKGRRGRSVVVNLEGLVAVTTAEIPANYVEKMPIPASVKL